MAPAQDGNGSPAAANTGSGSGGRKRRRRRKNKGGSATAAQAAGSQPSGGDDGAQPAQFAAAPVAAQVATQSPAQLPAQPQNGHMQGGGKRKNRKRSGGGGGANPNPQPGNGNGQNRSRQNRPGAGQNGSWRPRSEGPDGNREGARGGFGSEPFQDSNGGARRKGKFGRRGPTSFVGPMDHSYRMANGNIADGPPSTMDYRSANGNANGNISSRSDYAEFAPVAATSEDTRTRIVCFIEDLFVVAKMQEAARKLGIKIQFAKAEKETLAAITDAPEAERPSLIVFDLNNANAKPLTSIPKLKAKLKRGTSIIGFLQHIQGDLKMKAIEAGCDSVMPRSAFSQNLPNLLRRHGFDETEEMIEA